MLHRVVEKVVHGCKASKAEVMIATHNQQSIEHAVALMHELDMEPSKAGVFFGQLLGMSDPLTFVLGANGYKVHDTFFLTAWQVLAANKYQLLLLLILSTCSPASRPVPCPAALQAQ